MDAVLIYPHQLFESHPALSRERLVFLIEDELYFDQYPFHKQKLVFHRTSMKRYCESLITRGYEVVYVEASSKKDLLSLIKEKEVSVLHLCEVDDDWLSKKIKALSEKCAVSLNIYETPAFLTPYAWSKDYFKNRKYFQTNFYIEQRKRLQILLDKKGEPIGGHWTYDSDNRQKLPKNILLPKDLSAQSNTFINDAILYVNTHYANNPGSVEYFVYPTSHEEARKFLEDFLIHKLSLFGTYQDAITNRSKFVFHSVLSALINVGLLTPQEVVTKTLEFASHNKVDINSLEGFIRQIVGWREFLRAVYRLESRKQRTKNFFSFERKIPQSFWDGTTGIFPIDTAIHKILDTAYAHHIERLMILGNFMFLCEFDPDEVYRWFMIFFIDAYDWVMVPNVYGMSQYADGGLITTKPYLSSSNYIKNMCDYSKQELELPQWREIWDSLYWRFLHTHRSTLQSNPRMSLMMRQLDKMDNSKLSMHLKQAETYLESIG